MTATNVFTKTALLAGALLFTLTAWAKPPNPGQPGQHLRITAVEVNVPEPGQITIRGEDLLFGPPILNTGFQDRWPELHNR